VTTKSFHISDLLSVVPGIFVSKDGVSGIYNILNHLTGDELMTHQLPLASDAVSPDLIQQFPWLKDIPEPSPRLNTWEDCAAWVASLAAVHGEWHDVKPAPLSWGKHDPIADFRNEYPDTPIITVRVDGAS
jgi:hypothetical protein